MSENTSRFDQFYIKEDHFTEPKEYFKEALKIIQSRLSGTETSMLDIGCAAGDFLRYVHSECPSVNLHGMDAFAGVLDEARARVPGAVFHQGDMNEGAVFAGGQKFDVVTMLGVLSIFSHEQWIRNFCSLMERDGFGLIFGMINPYPYDVFVRLRNQKGENEYGWNSWSAATLTREFGALGYKVEIEHWTPPIDVSFRPEDPLRSWSLDLRDGGKIIANGSRMIHDFAFVRVSPGN